MIAVERLGIELGAFVLADVSFTVPRNAYGVLMGRTACGKTTILETICGLSRARSGHVVLDGRDVTNVKAADRGIGYVPQDGALFSTMSVQQHLAFALVVRRWARPEIEHRVAELADTLGITHLLDRRPHGLSGGERQRVALGRALSFRPTILCLDEPLSSLDEDTRQEMCDLLRTVARQSQVTTLHVTHSPTEARLLADRLFRLSDGVVTEDTASAQEHPPQLVATTEAGSTSFRSSVA